MDVHVFTGSSRVDRASYDPDRQVVLVQFPDGARWEYHDVSQREWDAFVLASSPGAYLNAVLTPKRSNPA